jgi:hypothetical protein
VKKIPSADKRHLDPEATRGDAEILLNGHVYECVISANRFKFAAWERVTPWRNPVRWVRIGLAYRKAYGYVN